MFKNYFKTAIRNLLKNKGFTTINVMGLALGIATCLLILLYVFDELSYDRYNKKAASIFRINSEIKFGGHDRRQPGDRLAGTPFGKGPSSPGSGAWTRTISTPWGLS